MNTVFFVARDGQEWIVACDVPADLSLAMRECGGPQHGGRPVMRWVYVSGDVVKRLRGTGRDVRSIGDAAMQEMIQRWRAGDAMAKMTDPLFGGDQP